ncbi:MAG: hypothetical protein ACO2XQ_09200, partial [Flavobacteriales bacterium]
LHQFLATWFSFGVFGILGLRACSAFPHLEGTLELAKEPLWKNSPVYGSFGTGVERDCGNACEFFGMGVLIYFD